MKKEAGRGWIPRTIILKITLLIILLTVVVSSLANFLIFRLNYGVFQNEIHRELLQAVSAGVLALDAEAIGAILSRPDEKSPVYLGLQRSLQSFQETNPGRILRVFALAVSTGQYRYLLDSVPVGSRNHFRAGDVFSETDFPGISAGLNGAIAVWKPLIDDNRRLMVQTAFAPIRNRSGQSIGVLAVQMDVSVLRDTRLAALQVGAAILFSSVLLALGLGAFFTGNLVQPLQLSFRGCSGSPPGNRLRQLPSTPGRTG